MKYAILTWGLLPACLIFLTAVTLIVGCKGGLDLENKKVHELSDIINDYTQYPAQAIKKYDEKDILVSGKILDVTVNGYHRMKVQLVPADADIPDDVEFTTAYKELHGKLDDSDFSAIVNHYLERTQKGLEGIPPLERTQKGLERMIQHKAVRDRLLFVIIDKPVGTGLINDLKVGDIVIVRTRTDDHKSGIRETSRSQNHKQIRLQTIIDNANIWHRR